MNNFQVSFFLAQHFNITENRQSTFSSINSNQNYSKNLTFYVATMMNKMYKRIRKNVNKTQKEN